MYGLGNGMGSESSLLLQLEEFVLSAFNGHSVFTGIRIYLEVMIECMLAWQSLASLSLKNLVSIRFVHDSIHCARWC